MTSNAAPCASKWNYREDQVQKNVPNNPGIILQMAYFINPGIARIIKIKVATGRDNHGPTEVGQYVIGNIMST